MIMFEWGSRLYEYENGSTSLNHFDGIIKADYFVEFQEENLQLCDIKAKFEKNCLSRREIEPSFESTFQASQHNKN